VVHCSSVLWRSSRWPEALSKYSTALFASRVFERYCYIHGYLPDVLRLMYLNRRLSASLRDFPLHSLAMSYLCGAGLPEQSRKHHYDASLELHWHRECTVLLPSNVRALLSSSRRRSSSSIHKLRMYAIKFIHGRDSLP